MFTTTNGSNVVTVNLTNNGYAVGVSFPVLVSTFVGGVTLFGNYVVQSVVDANNFTIVAAHAATSGASATLNNGTALFVYNGIALTPPSALPILAADWTLDNFGEDLIACPTSSTEVFAGLAYQPIYVWNPLQATARSYRRHRRLTMAFSSPCHSGNLWRGDPLRQGSKIHC